MENGHISRVSRAGGRAGNGIRSKLKPERLPGLAARFILRSAGWAAALLAFDLAAPYTGVSVAVNPLTAAACGALGVPGFGLVLCAAALFM